MKILWYGMYKGIFNPPTLSCKPCRDCPFSMRYFLKILLNLIQSDLQKTSFPALWTVVGEYLKLWNCRARLVGMELAQWRVQTTFYQCLYSLYWRQIHPGSSPTLITSPGLPAHQDWIVERGVTSSLTWYVFQIHDENINAIYFTPLGRRNF